MEQPILPIPSAHQRLGILSAHQSSTLDVGHGIRFYDSGFLVLRISDGSEVMGAVGLSTEK